MGDIISVWLWSMSILSGVLSILFFVLGVYWIVIIAGRRGRVINKKKKVVPSHMVIIMIPIILIFAIWAVRLGVGLYDSLCAAQKNENPNASVEENPNGSEEGKNNTDKNKKLKPGEAVFNSIVHTLQTVSLDEDYEHYVLTSKDMITQLAPDNPCLQAFCGIYVSVLNALAPILGGAYILGFLIELIPEFRLWFVGVFCFCKKNKFYFSELNDNSLALAKSIISKNRHCHLIFTDAYVNRGEEGSSERLAEAKELNAICVRTDLLHIKIHKRGGPVVFLIDESENSNLQTLSSFLERSPKELKNIKLYVFSSDKSYTDLDEEVGVLADKKSGRLGNTELVPVNPVRNMADNLFTDVPLFEPVIARKIENDKTILKLTILGGGVIGTEIFLAAYWMGQMPDVELRITVISKEEGRRKKVIGDEEVMLAGAFEGKINFINPEIMKTAKSDPPDSILRYCDDETPDDPYFTYKYIQADVMRDDLDRLIKENDLLDTDYFTVALGSDEDNFTVANRLRQIIGLHHLMENKGNKLRTVISYVIYNSDLCRALNEQCGYRYSTDTEENDILMYAFGSLEEVYSLRNVSFDDETNAAVEGVYDIYETLKQKGSGDNMAEKTVEEILELTGFLKKKKSKGSPPEENDSSKEKTTLQETDLLKKAGKKTNGQKKSKPSSETIYNYRNNLAKVIHRKYKYFSAGFYDCSEVFLNDTRFFEKKERIGGKKEKNYENNVKNKLNRISKKSRFTEMKIREALDLTTVKDPADRYVSRIIFGHTDDETKEFMRNTLAWTEHRRWCAFQRISGNRAPRRASEDGNSQSQAVISYLDKELPEHIPGKHRFSSLKIQPCIVECRKAGGKEKKKPDYLDQLEQVTGNEFKKYDYPEGDVTRKDIERFIANYFKFDV